MSNTYSTTYCVYGGSRDILKIYYKFQQLIENGVITQANPWMGNMVKALGKTPEDYPCSCDYLGMYIRDYDNEDITRLYIDTCDYSTLHPEAIDLLIDAAGVSGKMNYACACKGVDEVNYFPDDSTSYLFVEPSDDALMTSISSYWVEETPAAEVAESIFFNEFTAGDDSDVFLS